MVASKTSSGQTLSGQPPIVIAHRGASGYLPEHTLAAYKLAIDQGADFIEPDLVSTQDGALIARHEPNLIHTTNVADLPHFTDRYTTKSIDGIPQTGFFAEDFTLTEIKQLRARQAHSDRDQTQNDRFEIPTLLEILELVQQAEANTGKRVGIYPETKHPTYFAQLGLALEQPLIATLVAQQFTDPQRVFIQSFEVTNLQTTLPQLMQAEGLDLPLVQLFGELQLQPYDFVAKGDRRTYEDLLSPESLKEFVSTYARAIGLWKRSLVLAEAEGLPDAPLTGEVRPIITHAHAARLLVHLYTFRNEPRFLASQYQGNPIAEYQQFYQLGADGVFSDFPDAALQALAS